MDGWREGCYLNRIIGIMEMDLVIYYLKIREFMCSSFAEPKGLNIYLGDW